VVSVIVSVEDCVHSIDSGRDHLQSELGWRIDQKPSTLVGLNQGSNTISLIARIRRMADGASASNLRNTEARSCSEKGQLHAT
jgi:hypothetical protein